MANDVTELLADVYDCDYESMFSKIAVLSNDTYQRLVVAFESGDTDEVLSIFGEVHPLPICEATGDRNKITGTAPKPRDPIARELEKGQYQPKVTPNKRELMNRTETKHKQSFSKSDLQEAFDEVTALPSIKKMLSLAGRPYDDDAVEEYVKSKMGLELSNLAGYSDISVTQAPVPTPVMSIQQSTSPSIYGSDDDFDFDAETTAVANDMSIIDQVKAACDNITSLLPQIRFNEYEAAKEMINQLNSAIDTLGRQ